MKITTPAKELLATLGIANRAIGARASMPILDCAMIRAEKGANGEKGRVHIMATNLDIAVSASYPVDVINSGAVCVPGKRVQSIIAALVGESATIEVTKNHSVVIKCGPSTFKIMGIGIDEFPAWNDHSDAVEKVVFTQPELADIIASVEAAQSTDETRFVLNGTLFERVAGKQVFAVATDGRRIHRNEVTSSEEATADSKIIIPVKALAVVSSLLGDSGNVTIRYNQRHVHFLITRDQGDVEITSKLIEANFPAWRPVVKISGDGLVTVNRLDFLSALNRAQLACSEKYNAVTLAIAASELVITASAADVGDAKESILCNNPKNLAGKVGANVDFLIAGIQSVTSEAVILNLCDGEKMAVSPIGLSDGKGLQIVIMPVRLS